MPSRIHRAERVSGTLPSSRLLPLAILFVLSTTAGVASGGQTVPYVPESVIYGGIGSAQDQQSTPWTIGYLYMPRGAHWTFGTDFSGEGTARNNTTGYSNNPEQAWSWNLLIGGHWAVGPWDLGVAPLVGMRSTNKECPSGDSYLGYQCYADEDPQVSFTVNSGVVAHASAQHLMFGVRRTTASAQVLVGVRF